MFSKRGFTFVELSIVVVIIGVLTAIVIPNYSSMQDRAKEAKVKGNVRALNLAAEDFAVQSGGDYSTAAVDLLPLLPGGFPLENAFTGNPTEPQFGMAAAQPGEIGIEPIVVGVRTVGYIITGFGKTEEILRLGNGGS